MSDQDKSFIFRFQMVLGILVAAAVVFFIIASVIVTQSGDETSGEGMFTQAIEQRIAPVGQVSIQGQANTQQAAVPAAAPAAGAAHAELTGEQVVTQTCMACHGTGVMGAPKIGNKADWAP
ncbi:MAG: hypothetical protein KGJ12_05750, partial [Gammaproteobacteria bacterium]|nr:hypothetical protein [Gammaproteobacteria bacterium]